MYLYTYKVGTWHTPTRMLLDCLGQVPAGQVELVPGGVEEPSEPWQWSYKPLEPRVPLRAPLKGIQGHKIDR